MTEFEAFFTDRLATCEAAKTTEMVLRQLREQDFTGMHDVFVRLRDERAKEQEVRIQDDDDYVAEVEFHEKTRAERNSPQQWMSDSKASLQETRNKLATLQQSNADIERTNGDLDNQVVRSVRVCQWGMMCIFLKTSSPVPAYEGSIAGVKATSTFPDNY